MTTPNDNKILAGDPEHTATAAVTVPGQIPLPPYTWQAVINATCVVATPANQDYLQWLTSVGFMSLLTNSLRSQPYTGTPIANWPLPPGQPEKILDLLAHHSAAELAQLAGQALHQHDQDQAHQATLQRQKFGSNVGIHGAPGVATPPRNTWAAWLKYLADMGMQWYKQCDDGSSVDMLDWLTALKQAKIEPIVRCLVSEQFPDNLPAAFFARMQQYVLAGVTWVEIGNEPNLDVEWKAAWRQAADRPVSHTNPKAIQRIAETWLADAQHALAAGVKPAFYAFAPTDWRGASHPQYSSVFFTQKVVSYLAQNHRADTVALFQHGAWLAVHSATYEQPNDFDPFGQPGAVWDMTLRGYEVVLKAFRDSFSPDLDVDQLVIMSTEGGVFTPDSTSMAGHDRLHTDAEHAQRVVDMFRWLERNSPLRAMCPWCLSVGSQIGLFVTQFQFDGWIEQINGQLQPRAVYDAMRQLSFDHTHEDEELTQTNHSLKLKVPYISQFDATAGTHSGDCGPTCLAMIFDADPNSLGLTVDQIYQKDLPAKPAGAFTSITEMINVCAAEGLVLTRTASPDSNHALAALKATLQNNTPFVVLVNYAKWDDIAQNNYKDAHFVVVTGFDDANVMVHDPIFRGTRRDLGEYFVWQYAKFLDGWGSCHENDGNPDFVALIPNKKVQPV